MLTFSVPPYGDESLDSSFNTAGRRDSSLDSSSPDGANNDNNNNKNNTKIPNHSSPAASEAGTKKDAAVAQIERTNYAVPPESSTTV